MVVTRPPQARSYIVCKYVPRQGAAGKTDKIPLHPVTLQPHSVTDAAVHISHAEAVERAAQCGDGYGVGFVCMENSGYIFIDLDNCLQSDNTWSETAMAAVGALPGAYVEVSHSGRGLHIICRYDGVAAVTGRRVDALGVEIYTQGRFCALTGTLAVGDAESVHTEAINAYVASLGLTTSPERSISDDWTTECLPGLGVPDSNDEVIATILALKPTSNEVFGQVCPFLPLWQGDPQTLSQWFPTSGEGAYDASAADSALAYRLDYYLGGNCERVEQCMRMSGLAREKWDVRGDYLPRTITNARRGRSNYFDYDYGRAHHTPVVNDTTQPQQMTTMHYPELSERGRVLDTATNARTLLSNYGVSVRWNTMTREREIGIPGCKVFTEDAENFALKTIKDLALNNSLPIARIDEHLDLLAQNNNYHPIVEGLAANPWDGVPRLDRFIGTLTTTNQKLSYKLIRRWMVSAIAAAHSERGFTSQGVLVLAGEQNLGKTRWIQGLDPFNCSAVKTGATLDPKDKDCVRTLASFWISELGELDGTFRKADIARIKSYLTEAYDRIRLPYAHKDSVLPRRTVFAATVNDAQFLVDDTGNRRWWTIHVTAIDNNHGLDMKQVWAEVYDIWKRGEQTWLPQDELLALNSHNTEHEQLNPLEELLHSFFDFSDGWREKECYRYSSTEVLRVLGINNPSRHQSTLMGKVIAKATGTPPERTEKARLHTLLVR